KLQEAEELAKLSVQEAEHLKSRITGLEERLQVGESSPVTPLILPPLSHCHPLSDNEVIHERNLKDNESSRSGQGASSDMDCDENIIITGDTAVVTAQNNSQATAHAVFSDICASNFEDVNLLKDIVTKLQEELSYTKQEYATLKEREAVIDKLLENQRLQLESKLDSLDGGVSSETNENVSSDAAVHESLKSELSFLREERDILKKKLAQVDEEYQLLGVQNKMMIPTWVMVLLVLALALGSEFFPSLI
ncbi:hypothetical protein SK128_023240, partial [Halocaridina rubra]